MNSRMLWAAIVVSVCISTCAHAGTIEICKVSDPSGSLVDPFYFFTIGGTGLGSILVPVDACTDPISVPDGQYVISETPDPTSMLESVTAFPDFALISVDLPDESATILADGGTDPTQEVTVSFTNTPAVVPEAETGWLVGIGLTVCILCGNLRKRLYTRRIPPCAGLPGVSAR